MVVVVVDDEDVDAVGVVVDDVAALVWLMGHVVVVHAAEPTEEDDVYGILVNGSRGQLGNGIRDDDVGGNSGQLLS